MKMTHRIGSICVLMLLCVPVLHAKDPAAYRVGDVSKENIVTPVTLDEIDTVATAALKSSEAMKTPAIFRVCSDVTNALANEFLAEFAGAQSNFIAAVQDTFHQATLDDATIASPDFGYLESHRERMDYATARRNGEPQGSEAIESTCRQYQCRFKRPGQFWSLVGDEGLMCLESFWRNDRWHLLFPHILHGDPRRN